MDNINKQNGGPGTVNHLEQSPVTRVEIDLDRLEHNVRVLQHSLGASVSMLPVVKANAYGHGDISVSERLQHVSGVKGLAVASVAEGMKLRSAGIVVPIKILEHSMPGQEREIVEYDLISFITGPDMIRELALQAKQRQKKVPVQIRVDTETGNMGLTLEELPGICRKLKDMPWLECVGVFTHLYSAYSQNDRLVSGQLALFNRALEIAQELEMPISSVHAASSPAILRYPAAHYNVVRPGTVLYGLPSFADQLTGDYRAVMQLKSRINSIKKIPADSMITGYTTGICCSSSMRLATVPLGYADAPFLMNMKEGEGEVLVRQKKVPVVGSPFMMHLLIDVTGLPDVRVGDEVVFFGKQGEAEIKAEEVAQKAGIGVTNCEKVCFLSSRIPRSIK